MHNLLNIIFRYSRWFVFTFYVVLSCVLLFDSNNPYQHHVYLTSANEITASVYRFTSGITSYFYLKDINDDLLQQNADLELQVISLNAQIKRYQEQLYADTMKNPESLNQYDFQIAHVISNSISKPYNYITIDKGSEDGITPEMGVFDQNGIVGVVDVTGKHNSRIISLLNPNFRISCKAKNSDYFGSLIWDGKNCNEAIVEEMPRHALISKGDTIVTSGYSAVFPEGIAVGVITNFENSDNDNFHTLRVKLFTDFAKLSIVKVVSNRDINELKLLQPANNDTSK